MLALGPFSGWQFDDSRGDDIRCVETIDWLSDGDIIDEELDDGIVASFGQDDLGLELTFFGDFEFQAQGVLGLCSGPPDVVIGAPTIFGESSHVLALGVSPGLLEDLHRFGFDSSGHGSFGGEFRSGTAQGDLGWAGQIPDDVADFFGLHLFEQSVGHEREFREFALFDFVFGDDDQIVDGFECQCAIGFFGDQSREDPSIVELQEGHLVVFADDRVGSNEVFENVVQVCPVRACQIRTDFLSFAEELMACHAVFIEQQAALAQIGFGKDVLGELRFVFFDRLFLFFGGGPDFAPGLVDSIDQGLVVEADHLTDMERVDLGSCDFSGIDRVEEFVGEWCSRYERGDRVFASRFIELGIESEQRIGGVCIGHGREGSDGRRLESFGIQDGIEARCEFFVASFDENIEGLLALL